MTALKLQLLQLELILLWMRRHQALLRASKWVGIPSEAALDATSEPYDFPLGIASI